MIHLIVCLALRSLSCLKGIGGTKLTSEVDLDQSVTDAIQPFDFSFNGTSSFTLPTIPTRAVEILGRGGVGLLQGPSGTGKTSLMRLLLAAEPASASCQEKNPNLCVAGECFAAWATLGPLNSVVPVELLDVVCLPRRCHKLTYDVLSTGERFMADLARTLMYATHEGTHALKPFMPGSSSTNNATVAIGVDEFTSTVDRTLARRVCCSLSNFFKKNKLQRGILLATCHVDVAAWLCPDWTFDTGVFDFIDRTAKPKKRRRGTLFDFVKRGKATASKTSDDKPKDQMQVERTSKPSFDTPEMAKRRRTGAFNHKEEKPAVPPSLNVDKTRDAHEEVSFETPEIELVVHPCK